MTTISHLWILMKLYDSMQQPIYFWHQTVKFGVGVSGKVDKRNSCRFLVSTYCCVMNVVILAGDLWNVVCSSTYWRRADKVRLRHVVTNQ